MNIKDLIKKEALVKEATTVRIGDTPISKELINSMKRIIKSCIVNIGNEIEEVYKTNREDYTAENIEKQAKTLIRNYLKGVI